MKKLIFACLFLVGCVAVPQGLEDAIHSLHKGNIIIAEDYIELVIEKYDGEERVNKLKIIESHLKLSEEADKYVEGKGGELSIPFLEKGDE